MELLPKLEIIGNLLSDARAFVVHAVGLIVAVEPGNVATISVLGFAVVSSTVTKTKSTISNLLIKTFIIKLFITVYY